MVKADERPSEVLGTTILRAPNGRIIRAKSAGQRRYVDAMRENVLTFAIGPAGTGKTWLAVAMEMFPAESASIRSFAPKPPPISITTRGARG